MALSDAWRPVAKGLIECIIVAAAVAPLLIRAISDDEPSLLVAVLAEALFLVGLLARIFAIRGVDRWLNRFGIGSGQWPHYWSTYCIHDEHAICRLTCKLCGEKCQCRCHLKAAGGGPIIPEASR